MTEPFEANRALWEEWAILHPDTDFYAVQSFIDGTDPVRLRDYEIEHLGPLEGKTVLHLQCHFGLDSLSFVRLGAKVTGVDYSSNAIETARRLAEDTKLQATFLESDIYKLPENLEGEFDIVYASRGIVGWLPDFPAWMRVAAHFVKPGGTFYLNEVHPVIQAFNEPADPADLRPVYHYFPRAEPLVFDTEGSYADRSAEVEQPKEFGWQHSIGEIVTAAIDAGLRIEFLHEYPFLEWPSDFAEERDGKWHIRGELDGRLPLSFSLKATKS